jgi:hypothetical protein
MVLKGGLGLGAPSKAGLPIGAGITLGRSA